MSADAQRYSAVAIVLHWAIAAAILLMIPFGWWMGDQAEEGNVGEGVFRAYQLHKSVGLTVLALSVARLVWRLIHPPPPLPSHMPAWERFAAVATHWAFYALMIGLPLSGWVYVSAGWSVQDDAPLEVATRYFDFFAVPDLFGLTRAGDDVRSGVAEAAMSAHSLLAWATLVLAGLHVAAALKHHFFDRDSVLANMIPGVPAAGGEAPAPRNPARLAVLGGGLGLTGVALASGLFAFAGMAADTSASTAPAQPAASASATTTTAPRGPHAWRIDPSASTIGFSFGYRDEAGGETRFSGQFSRWSAAIVFNPDDLPGSYADVSIETASASDGVVLHDRSLPTAPWFNSAVFPTARFRTTAIEHLGGANYLARGALTIRDRTRDVELPFTLTISGDRAIMAGRTTIERRDFDVGDRADADDVISRDVQVIVRVEAERAS